MFFGVWIRCGETYSFYRKETAIPKGQDVGSEGADRGFSRNFTVEMHVEVQLWKCNLWKWSARQDWEETRQGPGPILLPFRSNCPKHPEGGTLGNTKDSARSVNKSSSLGPLGPEFA